MTSSDTNWISIVTGVSAAVCFGALYFQIQKATGKKDESADVEEIILRRRTIKPDTFDRTKQVPRDIIEKMLHAANWAPTHGKTEPWRFIIFSTKASIETLAKLDAAIYERLTKANKTYKEAKHKKRITTKTQSSYVIAICMERQKSEEIPEHEELIAVGMAVQNMHLVATKYNIGCYWSSGLTDKKSIGVTHDPEMKSFLKLKEKDQCLGFFCIGIPAKAHPLGQRRDLEEKIRWN